MVGTLNTSPNNHALDRTFARAGFAFSRLIAKDGKMSDQELARDADYQQLHKLGMQIALSGGEPAIRAAKKSILRAHSGETESIREELERFWCGMGSWSYKSSEDKFQS